MYSQLLLYVYERRLVVIYKILTRGGCLCCGQCSLANFKASHYRKEDYICDEDSSCRFEISDDEKSESRQGQKQDPRSQEENGEVDVTAKNNQPDQTADEANRDEQSDARQDALNAAAHAFDTLKLNDQEVVKRDDLIAEVRKNSHPSGVAEDKIDELFRSFDTKKDEKVNKQEWIDQFTKVYDACVEETKNSANA